MGIDPIVISLSSLTSTSGDDYQGVAICQDRKLVVVGGGHKVWLIDPVTKAQTVVAGSGEMGRTDGEGEKATFKYLSTVVVHQESGKIFVHDYDRHYRGGEIRVIERKFKGGKELAAVVSSVGEFPCCGDLALNRNTLYGVAGDAAILCMDLETKTVSEVKLKEEKQTRTLAICEMEDGRKRMAIVERVHDKKKREEERQHVADPEDPEDRENEDEEDEYNDEEEEEEEEEDGVTTGQLRRRRMQGVSPVERIVELIEHRHTGISQRFIRREVAKSSVRNRLVALAYDGLSRIVYCDSVKTAVLLDGVVICRTNRFGRPHSLDIDEHGNLAVMVESYCADEDSGRSIFTILFFEGLLVPRVRETQADMSQLWAYSKGKDVVFEVADQRFEAHRLVLMARSTYFETMFSSPMREANEGVVHVHDVKARTFEALLHFVYTSAIKPSLAFEDALELLDLSGRYLMPDLERRLRHWISANISSDERISQALDVGTRKGIKWLQFEAMWRFKRSKWASCAGAVPHTPVAQPVEPDGNRRTKRKKGS